MASKKKQQSAPPASPIGMRAKQLVFYPSSRVRTHIMNLPPGIRSATINKLLEAAIKNEVHSACEFAQFSRWLKKSRKAPAAFKELVASFYETLEKDDEDN